MLILFSSIAHGDQVVLETDTALKRLMKTYSNGVLFLGHGSKGQFKDLRKVFDDIDRVVERENELYGKGKWLAVFGGDGYNPDSPDIAHVLKYLKERHDIPVLAIQSDVVIGWGGVDKYIDYVRYIPTTSVSVVDEGGKPVLENGKMKMRTVWGGFLDGKPAGPTGTYLGPEFLAGKRPFLREVVAFGGGPIALQEAQYAYKNGVPVRYIRTEVRFPEVNGPYGSLENWVNDLQVKGNALKTPCPELLMKALFYL
jgi:hypothetical protein